MTKGNEARPYGPKYQQMCAQAAIDAGCKGNAMGILYCLFHQSGLFDWNTGQTVRPISHNDIGEAMGGLDYDTVRRLLRQLRAAGILGYADHRGRAVKWSDGSGHANKYKLLLPPIGGGVKKPTPSGEKHPAPRGNKAHHYHSSILPNGEKASAGRRQGAKSRAKTPEEQAQFSQLEREYSYGYALSWWKDLLKKETEAAE